MDIQETLTIIGLMLAPAFFSLLGMAGLGSPAMAVLGEISAKCTKRSFSTSTVSRPAAWA